MARHWLYAIVVLIWLPCVSQAVVDYNVSFDDPNQTYSDYYSEIQSTLLAAGADWSNYLIGNTTINLQVDFDNESTASGGSTTSQYLRTDNGISIFAQGAAYKVVNGTDPGVTIDGTINIGVNYLEQLLWFDPDPTSRTTPMPEYRVDAVSVFLHELGHIFAFSGWRDGQTGDLPGAYGSPFDELVTTQQTAGGTTLFFTGANAEKVYGGPVPVTYNDYSHFGNNPPRPGSELVPHELMNGVVFNFYRYYISPLDLAVFEDTGVPVNTLLLLGDTNDDGKIDASDMAVVTTNLGHDVTGGYADGDFNGDGVVNGDDVALFSLGAAYRQSILDTAPEPVGLPALALLAISLRRRRMPN